MRAACPGMSVALLTAAGIEPDGAATCRAIAGWAALPDDASVNLCEPEAPAVIATLWARGGGVEAGLASMADATRLSRLVPLDAVLRVLIEPAEQEEGAAVTATERIAALLWGAAIDQPILLHGTDRTVWPLITLARHRG